MINSTKQITKKNLKYRLVFDICFIIGALILPWWTMFIAIIVAVFMFGFFWEGVLYAIIIDSVFGVSTVRFWSLPHSFTLLVLSAMTISLIIRRGTRMYAI
jgi:hypothetical protein